jgi:hypothetical protein
MRIPCLSIQQPWAAMILTGEKPVENRGWTWMKDRDWQREGRVLLGIHSSTKRQIWSQLTDREKDKYVPGWRVKGSQQFGSVLGVADLLCICRPNDLPRKLRNHDSVNTDPGNWCWVLANPRRLASPIPATGQARLFYVEIPDALMPP